MAREIKEVERDAMIHINIAMLRAAMSQRKNDEGSQPLERKNEGRNNHPFTCYGYEAPVDLAFPTQRPTFVS